jgi:U3 small nucleolar RNA-associated protein 14
MSLKHKNTSKWAKAQSKYAKYSDRARDQVQEQLELSKQLTKKIKRVELEEEDDEIAEKTQNELGQKNATTLILNQNGLLVNNPWMKMMKGVGKNDHEENEETNENNNLTDFAKPKAFSDKTELENAQKQIDNDEEDSDDNDLSDDQEMEREKHENKRVTSIFKTIDSDEEGKKLKKKSKKQPRLMKKNEEQAQIEEKAIQEKEVNIEKNIEPVNFEVKTSAKNSNNLVKDEKDKQLHQLTLSEAFADDDVIEEFKMEKV